MRVTSGYQQDMLRIGLVLFPGFGVMSLCTMSVFDITNIASFQFSVGGLAGQVRAPARRSEYLTRVEEAS
jgi:hypothetical protein